MKVNLALPFFRDSKLRVGGTGGVWESPLEESDFQPIINPWVEKKQYNCMTDTLYFDDHSILNHTDVTWEWSITPAPTYISSISARNPKVVLGSPGSYTVSLTVNKGGQSYNRTIPNMVSTTTCPSVLDCSNPAELSKSDWSLISVDSEEPNAPGLAVMSFDNDFSTIWHTAWTTGDTPYPHEIQIDMGSVFNISKFIYYPRQVGENGRIKDFELFISNDFVNWGSAVYSGTFQNTSAPQNVTFSVPVTGRFFKLVALFGDVNGNSWASAAEFSMIGCLEEVSKISGLDLPEHLFSFPVPSNQDVNIVLPAGKHYTYSIFSQNGKLIETNKIFNNSGTVCIELKSISSGVYFINFVSENGSSFRTKVVKM